MVEERLRFLVDGDWARPLKALTRLRYRLDDVDFETTSRLPWPGRPADLLLDPANLGVWLTGGSNQFHRSAVAGAFRRWMARSQPEAVALHELLTLGQSIDREGAVVLLGADLLDELVEAEVLEAVDGSVRSNVLAVARSGLFYVSDPVRFQNHPDYVYAGRSSFSAPEYLSTVGWRPPSQERRRLLDLGCGAGFAAVAAAASGVERVVASDIVERCLYFCQLNAALNGLENVDVVRSDLFSDILGDFDVIISNAPCVWEEVQRATFATGGAAFGTELPIRMIDAALDRLYPGGLLLVVMSAPIIRGHAYIRDALAEALGSRSAEVRIHPLISEYGYRHADTYRRNRISQFVRYLVAMVPDGRRSIRLLPTRDVRFGCYRARGAAVRLAASISGAAGHAR